jgi:hypothetical protein
VSDIPDFRKDDQDSYSLFDGDYAFGTISRDYNDVWVFSTLFRVVLEKRHLRTIVEFMEGLDATD